MGAAEFSFEALDAPVSSPKPGDAVDRLAGETRYPGGADGLLAREAAAAAEADALREAARAEGFEAGRAEALAMAAPALQALDAAVAAMAEERAAAADRLEVHAVDLALFLAERVLAGAIAVQPERVVEAVRGALRALVERERVTVLVHPDDLEIVRAAMDGLRVTLGGIEHCEVQAERRVTRGGAVVRTPDGDVDARIETKLARAREVVEAAL
jgi:flagellar biosynthesis/type III secretory pathway protein FliH